MGISLFPENRITRVATIAFCLTSYVAGILTAFVMNGQTDPSYIFPIPSVFGDYRLVFDQLSSIMISFSSLVFLMVLVHALRSENKYRSKYIGLMTLLFLSCAIAMCSDSVILLLISWELITITTFLMSFGADETARWRYFTITHFGGLIIMAVFVAMWFVTGTTVLSEMGGMGSIVGTGISATMIFLLFIGFGTKLGIIPFHVWMPDLYDSTPIHTIALLSTVCSSVAVVILLKSTFLWIGVPQSSILPLAIIALASGSAIWGAMESLIQTDPRRILAYSGMENMSMVMLCLASGMIFLKMDFDDGLFVIISVAAVLHTINHSFFKSLMLLCLGTVEENTGLRNMDKMGGLAKTLPILSVFALIGTAAMAALPPMNGFVSEWLMIKTVIDAGVGESVINLVLPLIVTVLGICGMMAAVSYARLYGFMFLGRPRSEAVTKPKKTDAIALASLGVLSGACIILGILAIPIINILVTGICSTLGITYAVENIVSDSLHPIAITAILFGICLTLYAAFRIFKKDRKTTTTWDCGTELKSNMQYSSSGFTQPLVRVFHPFYGDISELSGDNSDEKRTYNVKFIEPFIIYVMQPIGKTIRRASEKIGMIQNGNIQSYLGYILATLIVILLGARFI